MTLSTIAERTTDSIAVGAVVSPIWLPYVENVSEFAALMLPIAGLFWLIVQIWGYLRGKK